MRVDIRIEGEPEEVARFLKEMAIQQIVDLAGGARGMEDFPIEKLRLGVRVYNRLRRAEIDKIGDLASRTADELLAISGFGSQSLLEVQEALAAHGLQLRPKGLPVAP